MEETWKDIPGYDGKYQADKEGNVRRVYKSGKTRILMPYHKDIYRWERPGCDPYEFNCEDVSGTGA